MIALDKGDEPNILQQKKGEWTRELLQKLEEDKKVGSWLWARYRHDDIKAQLKNDSAGKCIYCESEISHVTYAHIEHLKPKSAYPAETFEWENLGLACPRCNVSKGDRYDEQTPPVNPYDESPGDFLVAVGCLIWSRPGSDRGKITVDLVDLNRPGLVEARKRRLRTVKHLAELVERAKSGVARAAFLQELCLELEDSNAYAFVARALVDKLEIECPS